MEDKEYKDQEQNPVNKTLKTRQWVGIGLVGGILIGFYTGNYGMWIAIGIICGVTMNNHDKKNAENEEQG